MFKGVIITCIEELYATLKVAENYMYEITHDRTIEHTKDIAHLEMSIVHCLVLLERLPQINKDLQ
jgi:hypothetical protein